MEDLSASWFVGESTFCESEVGLEGSLWTIAWGLSPTANYKDTKLFMRLAAN